MTAGALGTAKGCPWHASDQPGCFAGVILGGRKLTFFVYHIGQVRRRCADCAQHVDTSVCSGAARDRPWKRRVRAVTRALPHLAPNRCAPLPPTDGELVTHRKATGRWAAARRLRKCRRVSSCCSVVASAARPPSSSRSSCFTALVSATKSGVTGSLQCARHRCAR